MRSQDTGFNYLSVPTDLKLVCWFVIRLHGGERLNYTDSLAIADLSGWDRVTEVPWKSVHPHFR